MKNRHKLFLCFLYSASVSVADISADQYVSKGEGALLIDHVTAWPNLTIFPDQSILLAGFDKPSHGKVEGDVSCWISRDLGRTWAFQGKLTERDPQTVRMNHAVGINDKGELIALVSGWSDIQQPGAVKRAAFRDQILGVWVCRSKDNGKSWEVQKGTFPEDPEGRKLIPFGDIILSDDGSLGVSMYSTSYWDKPGPWAAFFVASTDNGQTWEVRSKIGDNINETALLYSGSGNWMAAARDQGTSLFRSRDGGRTWDLQGPVTSARQHPSHLLKLQDGRIVLTYGDRRKEQFGVGALVSDDNGETWGDPVRVASMAGWDGGYPSSVQLPDGRVLTVYYSKKGDSEDYGVYGVVWEVSSQYRVEHAP